MASNSPSQDESITITLISTNPNPIKSEEITISTNHINSWDLPSILTYHTVKIQINRNRLVEHSTYFRGLLSGSFSESGFECVSVEWNLETVLNMLKCVYGCPLEVTSSNFISLFEGALYFGVELLLEKCKTWFLEASSSGELGLMPIKLDDLIRIWKFCLEHGIDFVPELCVSYLVKNFMFAMSSKAFVDIPYELLYSCIRHHHLTVESEMHLSDALLIWLDANTDWSECLVNTEDRYAAILKQIRVHLLPLWFAAGKRRAKIFSKLAEESIDSVSRLIKDPSPFTLNIVRDPGVHHLKFRLSEYSMKVNLSSCPQMTSTILLLSLLPSSFTLEKILNKNVANSLQILEHLNRGQFPDLSGQFPTMSFAAVKEVDISKCPRLHLGVAIECFCKSFPSLRTLKATYLLNFKMETLWKLVQKCRLVSEVDLTVDISPLIPSQASVISSSQAMTPLRPKNLLSIMENLSDVTSLYYSGPTSSNITKLTLKGRTDVLDSDLQLVSQLCKSLCHLDITGCISVTDVGISYLIERCIKLHSIVACDTSFGSNSSLALCSIIPGISPPVKHSDSIACKLQMLHIGGCKGVDDNSLSQLISRACKLKSLCLRDTLLKDHVLCSFSGSSLEVLDVSNTMISGTALAHIVCTNPGLRCLKARGCKHLLHWEGNSADVVLGKTRRMEELVMGWGLSSSSLKTLRAAIKSIKNITVGLGASVGEEELKILPKTSPALESVTLYFQVISDSLIISMTSLMNLQALALCYCFGDLSISSFKRMTPNLRKLKLERVVHWMTNEDLVILTQNYANLTELSLTGCRHLSPDSQKIISNGWPGLISIHLEDCGNLTENGVSFLVDCNALEDLLLRHNGPGIPRNFIIEAASKMPMLRHISLDLCDASDGDFDIPDYMNRYTLSIVKIARCKTDRCSLDIQNPGARRRTVHKESLVLVWNSENLVRTVVKDRL